MKLRKYKVTDKEFLIYGEDDQVLPEEIEEVTLVKEIENIEEESFIPLYSFIDFMLLFLPLKGKVKRTRDKILAEVGVSSWEDLKYAYFLIQHRQSSFSSKIRTYVLEKYSEIVNNL